MVRGVICKAQFSEVLILGTVIAVDIVYDHRLEGPINAFNRIGLGVIRGGGSMVDIIFLGQGT